MKVDQFQKGLKNVLDAIDTALKDRHVEGARVSNDAQKGVRQTVVVTITMGDKTETQSFAPAELDDCGQAIDAPAALKVRMLVSHFVS